ncbi:type VI secretion system baseplate subunit TssE [Vannielia litorea]|uniref:Type VI secretion system protein ImpF n=1 Tax=Vannielia litorea TaxID=1217970 RepID=A0A1N6G148_9RHOB|nr:GPW/gp25 family protein [Vannielia litorea]SIO01238.1 type VI secretion system protein ImpF [Vannielia litorea]
MARGPEKQQQLQIPLMYAFREAFKARDAKIDTTTYTDGQRVLHERSAMRRRGANEAQLKRNLEIDLVALANTINLDAALDIEDLEYVGKSILNYGLVDLSNLAAGENKALGVPRKLARALLNNEPRFVPSSMNVRMREEFDEVNQKLVFDITAEMACKPVDIPLEFVAEIDVGSGKMKFSNIEGS